MCFPLSYAYKRKWSLRQPSAEAPFERIDRDDISGLCACTRSAGVCHLSKPAGFPTASAAYPRNGRAILSCRYIWPCNSRDVRPPLSPTEPVGSYPPFHPCRNRRRLFSVTCRPGVAAGFPLGNAMLCVARTFLLTSGKRMPRRQTSFLSYSITESYISYFVSSIVFSLLFLRILRRFQVSRRN